MFPALGIGYMFSRAWHRLHVFPRLAPVTCFPRLAPVTCFPALGTGYTSSRAWHRLHIFPRLAPVACFPALGTSSMFPALGIGYMFSCAWHRLHIFAWSSDWFIAVFAFVVIGNTRLLPFPIFSTVIRLENLSLCFNPLTPAKFFPVVLFVLQCFILGIFPSFKFPNSWERKSKNNKRAQSTDSCSNVTKSASPPYYNLFHSRHPWSSSLTMFFVFVCVCFVFCFCFCLFLGFFLEGGGGGLFLSSAPQNQTTKQWFH